MRNREFVGGRREEPASDFRQNQPSEEKIKIGKLNGLTDELNGDVPCHGAILNEIK